MRNIVGVLIVGWFSALFGCSRNDSGSPGRFVSEVAFRQNLAKQTNMSPQTLAQLRGYGVTEDAKLKLEFFFYTDTKEKASTLTKELRERLEYKVESRPSASDASLLTVTGWTTRLKLSEPAVVAWTEKMSRLGYENDCDFDGWGTNPEQ